MQHFGNWCFKCKIITARLFDLAKKGHDRVVDDCEVVGNRRDSVFSLFMKYKSQTCGLASSFPVPAKEK